MATEGSAMFDDPDDVAPPPDPFFQHAPARLRIGALDWPALSPLLHGLEEEPDVIFRRGNASDLAHAIATDTLDAALIPPLPILGADGVRVVPGIALVCPVGLLASVWSAEDVALARDTMPVVACIWACRFRAPYAALRRVLARARQGGLAHVLENQTASTQVSYHLGGDESQQLREILARAKDAGRITASADLVYC